MKAEKLNLESLIHDMEGEISSMHRKYRETLIHLRVKEQIMNDLGIKIGTEEYETLKSEAISKDFATMKSMVLMDN